MYSSGAKFFGRDSVHKICSSHIDRTETGMDYHFRTCPWQRMRIKKVTGDLSWCYVDDPVTKQQHGVGGNKKFTTTEKVAVPKISCSDGTYQLSKPLISNYGVAVSVFV